MLAQAFWEYDSALNRAYLVLKQSALFTTNTSLNFSDTAASVAKSIK